MQQQITDDTMPKAVIFLGEHENRIVNIIKEKYGLSNKSEAITYIINQYEKEIMEPELQPECVEKIREIQKEKPVNINDFRKHFKTKYDVWMEEKKEIS